MRKRMRVLIADDNVTNRMIMHRMLSAYGQCDQVANGREVLEAFELAWEEGKPYDLICLDIMMPELDGQGVLRNIRARESDRGLPAHRGVRIIMTTVLEDHESVLQAFRNQCEAYLVKPVTSERLAASLGKLGLIEAA